MNNKEKPLVSVIIPFYNSTKYIVETIESVKNQTYKNIELIVVDDCSPNMEEAKKLEKLAEKYKFKLIKKGKNEGASKAIQTGIENSKGGYISIVAQDDYYALDKIEHLLGEMQKNDLDALYSNGVMFEEGTNKSKAFDDTVLLATLKQGSKQVAELISTRDDVGSLLTQGALYKRKIFEDLKWVRNKFLLDDWPFTILVWRDYKTSYTPKITYYYRMHDDNTHKSFWKWFPARMQVIAELIPDDKKLKTTSMMFFNMAHYFLSNKMYEQAYRCSIASLLMTDEDKVEKLNLNLLTKIPAKNTKKLNVETKNKIDKILVRGSLGYKIYKKVLKLLIALVPIKKYRKVLRNKIV